MHNLLQSVIYIDRCNSNNFIIMYFISYFEFISLHLESTSIILLLQIHMQRNDQLPVGLIAQLVLSTVVLSQFSCSSLNIF